jgi:hypothetical protein
VGIQQRILIFVTRSNWLLLFTVSAAAVAATPQLFARGVIAGGLLVTINFHLMARTLKSALTPPHLSSHSSVLAKYYARLIASGFIIFYLISGHHVHPLGLFMGLSVVVVSLLMATVREIMNLIFKEAV